MFRYSNTKKGQSLVEVMVAMSIVILVLTASFTLVVTILNSVQNARVVTEATALAQKGIADGTYLITCGCDEAVNVSSRSADWVTSPDAPSYMPIIPAPAVGSQPTVGVTLYELDSTEENTAVGLSKGNFYRLVSKVSWNDKNGNLQVYTLSSLAPRGDNGN